MSVPSSLLSKAAAQGSVRVLVRLASPMVPEGHLPALADVHSQRQRIATAQAAAMRALAGLPHRVLHQYQTIPVLAVDADQVSLRVLAALSGVVLSVEEDTADPPLLSESVPLVGESAAIAGGINGTGQVIAVLDTGVDKAHPFLAGKVVAEACFSARANCPNQATVQVGSGAGVPCTYSSSCRHGTHVAGIASGITAGLAGVARGASIFSIQVFSRFDGDSCSVQSPCALSYVSDQLAALEHVLSMNAVYRIASVNMSLGSGAYTSACNSDVRRAAIDNLRSVGIATVAASGNGGYENAITAPACISSAVSVGSTDDGSGGTIADEISDFSNSSGLLSLLAPGRFILSSVPGGGYENISGTSMAAPHVSGAWALLKHARPTAPVTDILGALQATGRRLTDPRNGLTKSRISIDPALAALGPDTRGKTYTVAPCRVVDTRVAGGPIPANTARSFRIAGALSGQGGASNCGIAVGAAKGVHVNVVVVGPTAPAWATIHAYPTPVPLASTINFNTGQVIANGVLVPVCDASLSCPFDITVTMGPAASHIVIDVTGYTGP